MFVQLIADHLSVADEAISSSLYQFDGLAAWKHLFAVASALDSGVIGEPQVLGQLKAAHRGAAGHGLVGEVLERALDSAYAAARRVRRETAIAQGPVSLARAALSLARHIHGDLVGLVALLIGPTEMGELMAAQFCHAGLKDLMVCCADERLRGVAHGFAGNIVAIHALADAIAAADIVISSLGNGRNVLTPDLVASALRKRSLRPMFVIDAAVPADAEPAVNDFNDAFLYDLADLKRTAPAGRTEREAARAAAWAIIDVELADLAVGRAGRRVVSAVVALRRHIERLREEALAKGGDAPEVIRRLVNRLLHDPSEVLRQQVGTTDDVAVMEKFLCRLFRLSREESGENG